MTGPAPPQRRATLALLPGAMAVVAAAIFVVDTITNIDIAVAALYAAVVLMAARFSRPRGIVLVAVGCVVLTLLSFALSPPREGLSEGIINTGIAIATIGLVTLIAMHAKLAEARLREQAGLLDLTHDSIFVRGMDDVITFWNRGAGELYGWTSEEAVGKVAYTLLQTVLPEPLSGIKRELFRTGRWDGELIHTRRDGTQVVVSSRWSFQRGERGWPAMILETNNDITERKKAEQELQKTQMELNHAARVMMMGELTASIMHEVNQPLAAVITNSQAGLRWLAAEPPNLDEARECLNRMVRDGRRAGDVIARIRSLVKKAPPLKVNFDLNEAIEEVLAIIGPEAQRRLVRLRTEMAPRLPSVCGDRVQLQQVILNLVMNGIEAMAEVTDRPREILVRSCQSEAGAVLVAIQDNGMGLDAEGLERVFEAFYTTKPAGVGIGLSISRSIVEAHGGRLWPTANEPHGATFQFTLPTNDNDDQGVAELAGTSGA